MDFVVGDELVYNPSAPNLPPNKRLGDWGRVIKILNGYIHFRFYGAYEETKILPGAFTHSPRSPKYYRVLYKKVLTELSSGFKKDI